MLRVAGAAVLVILASAGPRAQPETPFTRADATIAAEMQKAGIPGAAVAVVVGDTVVWTKGFGVASVETGAAVTPDTLFQIGSMTKSLTAAAVLTAAAQGVLSVDRPASAYVAGLTACVGAATIAQLLSHTGGLIDEPDEFGTHGEDGLGAYQRTWTDEYCLLPPGRAFSYSNSGFALAGLALQEVAKSPFADVMKARVLGPLGMTRTTFRPTEAMTWPLAVGHRASTAGTLEVVRPLANDTRLWPAGTLYSSVNDLARFMVALMNDGRVGGIQALPTGVAARMRTVHVQSPSTSQGYGQGLFFSRGGVEFGHGGTMTGYVAQLTIRDGRAFGGPALPVGVVVLTNGDGVNPSAIVEVAMQAGTAEVARRTGVETITFSDGGPIPPRTLTEAEAGAFPGVYRNPRRFTVEVIRDQRGLVLKRFGRDFVMRPLAADSDPADRGRSTFAVDLPRGGSEVITFGLDAAGRADYLQMNVWALARVSRR